MHRQWRELQRDYWLAHARVMKDIERGFDPGVAVERTMNLAEPGPLLAGAVLATHFAAQAINDICEGMEAGEKTDVQIYVELKRVSHMLRGLEDG